MSRQLVNIGAVANDGTGDPLRDALDKNNDNFEEQKEERITKQNFASSMSNKLVNELSLLNDN